MSTLRKTTNIELKLLSIALACGAVICGQGKNSTPITPEQDPLVGFVPTGSYAVSDLESINMSTGNVVLRIPIASLPPGRAGLSAGLGLFYNSKVWSATPTYGFSDISTGNCLTDAPTWEIGPNGRGGWQYGINYQVDITDKQEVWGGCNPPICPSIDVTNRWKYSVFFPDGSAHVLTPSTSAAANDTNDYYNFDPSGQVWGCSTDLNGNPVLGHSSPNPLVFYTTDGTFARLEVSQGVGAGGFQGWTLYFADGRKVVQSNGVQQILDRNGNAITIEPTVDLSSNAPPGTAIVDDEGRNITITFGARDVITANGYNAQQLIFNVNYETISSSATYCNADPKGVYPSGDETTCSISVPTQNLTTVSSITIPAQIGSQLGTLSYTFLYGNPAASTTTSTAGQLSSATLPSGANVAYTYNSVTTGSPTPNYTTFLQTSIAQKTQTYAGQLGPEVWNYGIAVNGINSSVTAPDGGTTAQVFLTPSGLLQQTTYPDGSITENIWTAWGFGGGVSTSEAQVSNNSAEPSNPFISGQYHSVANSAGTPTETSIKLVQQDINGNTLQASEYGFTTYSGVHPSGPPSGTGTAALVRTTTNTYFGPPSGAANYYQQGAAQTLTSMATRQVSGNNNGSYSQFCYAPTGNNTSNGPTTSANLSLEAGWDSQLGPLNTSLVNCAVGRSSANSVAVVHDYTYDQFGNKVAAHDANNVTTQYVYADTCGGSVYPTSVSVALGTNVQETTTRGYDCSTGTVMSATDANSNTTTTGHDVFGRPTLVTKPDNTTITKTYSDSQRYVVTQTDLGATPTGGNTLTTIAQFDSLYRPSLTQTLENSSGFNPFAIDSTAGIKVERHYGYFNGGSFDLASNPYRAASASQAGSETTMGWVGTIRDTLNRLATVCYLSSAAQPTSPSSIGSLSSPPFATATGCSFTTYNADTATNSDEAGNTRSTTVDGVGRLVTVVESPGGLGYATNYLYDALDNLVNVAQGSLPARTFGYTSLSRLSNSYNPENGNISYLYDPNGNSSSRTDSQATTWIGYDPLNRVTSKTYSDGTPTAVYCYDGQVSAGGPACQPSSAAISNPIGKLTSVSNNVSASQYTSYDQLGRIVASQQITSGITYTFAYGYNHAGLLTSITYPGPNASAGRQITYSFDDANRYTAVCGSLQLNTTNYTSSACSQSTAPLLPISYAAHGAVTGAKFGGALVESRTFNSRLQPTQIQAGSLLTIGYTFSPTQNNGNVLGETINDGVNPVKTQTFTYDSLNRISGSSEDTTWQQSYCYDQFGNRALLNSSTDPSSGVYKIMLPATPSCSSMPFTNNRWTGTGVQYDNGQTGARGNLTAVEMDASDSLSAVYDAESRNTSVTTVVAGTSQTVNYGYDGEGKRITKSVSGSATTTFVYDAQGQLTQEHGSFAEAGTQYLTADHLGSTRLVSMISGGVATVLSRSDYLPFGQEIPATWNRSNYVLDALERIKYTSKERDSESGLDFFGARYMSSAQGRFTSPDPSSNGVALKDPQSWNLYSYVRNRPTRFVDKNGNWATDIHAQLVTAALQGYVSAGELRQLIRQQYIMDQDQSSADQYMHAMSNGQSRPPQSSASAANQMWDWVAWNMSDASANLRGDGSFSDLSLLRLGNAIHTVQDYTSPEHVSGGELLPWNGSFRFGAVVHVLGEIAPDEGWAGIGQAIRLTMAAFMQANPTQAASHGLTADTFNSEANRRITQYVDQFYQGIMQSRTNEATREAARQCALGNPAACGAN